MYRSFVRAVIISFIAAVLAGLTVFSARLYAEAAAAFPHKKHLEEVDECTQCHVAGKGDRPELDVEICTGCHEGEVDPSKITGRGRRSSIVFPHRKHAASGGMKCVTCHERTVRDAQDADRPLVALQQCEACHAEKGLSFTGNKCLRCHPVDLKTVKPADHTGAWKLRHGPESRWRYPDDHGRACLACHTRSRCIICHASSRPGSHNGLWRMRTHGTAAAWDRDRCKTCHETGSCIGCHRRTAPQNHRGAWPRTHGAASQRSDNRYCSTCHSSGWCARCHVGLR